MHWSEIQAMGLKEHIPKPGRKYSICSRKSWSKENPNGVVLLTNDWEERDIDPEQICSHCKKRYEKKIGKSIPQEHEDFPFIEDNRYKVEDLTW